MKSEVKDGRQMSNVREERSSLMQNLILEKVRVDKGVIVWPL